MTEQSRNNSTDNQHEGTARSAARAAAHRTGRHAAVSQARNATARGSRQPASQAASRDARSTADRETSQAANRSRQAASHRRERADTQQTGQAGNHSRFGRAASSSRTASDRSTSGRFSSSRSASSRSSSDGAGHAAATGGSRHHDNAFSAKIEELRDRRSRGAAQSAAKARHHEPGPLTRAVNNWFNRLMGIVNDRSFDQEEQYAANQTSRDFICNAVGSTAWGVVFPFLTVVATQLAGAENAGMFSLVFVTASLLMIVANFGVRTFQISDLDETYSFADYQANRIITCVIMLVAGYTYVCLRGYTGAMAGMCTGLFLYKAVDGFADVYEGRLQQVGKLYLAGVSQAVRSVAAFVFFCLFLLITGDLVWACMAMGIAAALTLAVCTVPLAYLETPKSRPVSLPSVLKLFNACWPLFVALFLYALIDNMPKFAMEGVLSYDNQLYFNAMYFPAQMILIVAQLVYKPLLVRMAAAWADPEHRRKFSLIILAVLAAILVITAAVFVLMATIGIPVWSVLYGTDFEQFRGLCYIMLVAGGVTAGIDFLYQTVTVLRRQRDVMVVYLITVLFALFVPTLLIGFTGLPGACISYLIVMMILFVLLVWVYGRIRIGIYRDERDAVRDREVERREDWERRVG